MQMMDYCFKEMLMRVNIIFLISLVFNINTFAQDITENNILVKDLDFDKINDSVCLDTKNAIIIY